eukprot:PhF_6_TR29977/c0_g1_i1/m.43886
MKNALLFRGWFVLTLLPILIIAFVLALLVSILKSIGLVSPRRSEGIIKYLTRAFIIMLLKVNPQIQWNDVTGWQEIIVSVPLGSVILLNHYSQLEVLYSAIFPKSFVWTAKGVYKASLGNIPIIGSLFRTAGHLPVYFRSTERT